MRMTYTGRRCCSSTSLCGFSSVSGSSAFSHGQLGRFSASGVSILLGDGTGVHIGVSTGSGLAIKTMFQCFEGMCS